MRRHAMLRSMILVALGCGVCSGCGSAVSSEKTVLIPVKGHVFYKGKALTKGMIRFSPDDYGRPASGQIQEDGTFELGTHKPGDGVIAGHHRVAITGTGKTLAKELIPRKYTQKSSSGLTADVDPEHTDFSFELK